MQQETANETPSKQLYVYAVIMALGTLASRVLGLIREILFASLFPRVVTDAWYVAFKIPNIFRRLFGEGSLSVSFIPVFLAEEKSADLRDGFFTLFLFFLTLLTLSLVVFVDPLLMFVLEDNFVADAVKYQLTRDMAQIMATYVFLVCLYAYFMALLNSVNRFGMAALAPAFFNLAMIASLVWPQSWQTWQGQALAWGVVVGGVLQAAILFPELKRIGMVPRLRWQVMHRGVGKVLMAMGPSLMGMGLLQITTLVNLHFASRLESGAMTYINLADRLLELPLSLVSVSMGTALLPSLSQAWIDKNYSQMRNSALDALRMTLFLCLTAGLALLFLAKPVVTTLFEHGRFTPDETIATAGVVQVYSLLLITTASLRVLVPNYYAVGNTWFPAMASGVGLAGHVLLAPVLMASHGLLGLALSTVLSTVVNLVLVLVGLSIFVVGFPYWAFVRILLTWVLPLSLVGGWFWFAQMLLTPLTSLPTQILGLAGVGVFAIVLLFLSQRIHPIPEWEFFERKIFQRLRRTTPKGK